MNWHRIYLEVYNKNLKELSPDTITKISTLIKEKQSNEPLASIVLIAHNEEKRILSCLWSLANNSLDFPIELLVVNNNSSDQTEELLKQLQIPYYNETQKGPGYARQCGLNHAKGKYYLCIDADTIYPPHYINTHIKTLMKRNVVAVYGLWSFIPDHEHSRRQLRLYEFIRDIYLNILSINRPELCVRGMCFSFKTEVGRLFGFRTDILRGEDGFLALNMKKHGNIVFIKTRKARVMTSCGTLNTDGTLFNSFKKRVKRSLKNMNQFFIKAYEYKDHPENKIK